MSTDGAGVLRDLRRARRRRAYGDVDWSDALYKVYVTGLLSAVGGSMLSGWVGGAPATPAELATSVERGPAAVGLVVAVVVAADLAAATATSPATHLGRLAMSALDAVPRSLAGLVLLALPAAGLAGVGGTALEAARRQAGLAAQLRFALTMQDVRTVILLRRQLAAEGPRRRPWARLPAGRRPRPVWRRDWHGILRWPAARILRMVLLGVTAGLAAAWAWRGTPALALAAGAALLVAALDSTEGPAQEADHPVRHDTLPVHPGRLLVRHLAAPAVVMLAVVAVGAGGATALGGASTPPPRGGGVGRPGSRAARPPRPGLTGR